MPSMKPIVLTDNSNVDHTFLPRGKAGTVATFTESDDSGAPVFDKRLTMSLTRTSTGKAKAVIRLAVPVVQEVTLNGVTKPTIVRTNYAELSFNFDASAPIVERNEMAGLIESMLTPDGTRLPWALIVGLEDLY